MQSTMKIRMQMIALVLLLPFISGVSCLTCPTSCGFISPVPYPFGAASGCGSPGFQLYNCSRTPQWNLILAGNENPYYVVSINASSSIYDYSGNIYLELLPNASVVNPICQISRSVYNVTAFSTLNLYAFQYANLNFLNDRYFFFNCTGSLNVEPPLGVLNVSSKSCTMLLNYCNRTNTACMEFSPDRSLYLGTLMSTYNCSAFKRFIIADEDEPISKWEYATQFTWDSVKYAENCNSCQSSGGTCGYNTVDSSFLCYCGNNTYQTNCMESSGNIRIKTIIGVVCTCGVIVLALAVILFFYRKKLYYWWVFRYNKHIDLKYISQAPAEFPYSVLVAATSSFSDKIGEGAIGKVYKGTIADGSEVAVKVLDSSLSHSNEQFLNELSTIGNTHHVNVARLFGYCFKGSRRILVYEYVCNNSLDKYLFSTGKSSGFPILSWKQRYSIALGIAQGLSYIHEECRSRIIHCDIKPHNILLDANYVPKIADFGLAKLLSNDESRILTHARGTPGYVAPEFWSFGKGSLSTKFDVYSYGVVLLEIVQGKRMFHQHDPFFEDDSFFRGDLSADEIGVSIDERISHDFDQDQVRTCIMVALLCIQEEPKHRPTMSKVVQYLQGSVQVPQKSLQSIRRIMNGDASSSSLERSSENLIKGQFSL